MAEVFKLYEAHISKPEANIDIKIYPEMKGKGGVWLELVSSSGKKRSTGRLFLQKDGRYYESSWNAAAGK